MEATEKTLVTRVEDDIVWSRLDDSVLIVATKLNEEKIYTLNKTAAHLWEICDGSKSVADMVQSLCRAYDIDAAVALKDTFVFIEDMSSKGLICLK